MAKIHINLYLRSLNRGGSFDVFIPNDPREKMNKEELLRRKEERKTLILLHGYTGDSWNWVTEELAEKNNLAVVSMNGENSFYLNGEATGQNYQTLVGEELIFYLQQTFGLATRRENTFLLGFSMGGYGAIHTGLAYPEIFGKIGAMSSALIYHGIAHMKPGEDNGIANYAYYHSCFGDLETIEDRDTNPEVQIKELKRNGKVIPDIYLCCGLQDNLLASNREFDMFLTEQNVEHIYRESDGEHNIAFWYEYTEKIIDWMVK